MKKCVLILPFFGEFNNYFQLFLNSVAYNPQIDLLIFTDNMKQFDYPPNVFVVPYSLKQIKNDLEKKLGFTICLNSPYKLCDYKPAYGLIFEDYIREYLYWGHCDCDLLFGDMQHLLFPLLDMNCDKYFAAGHLTIYKNNFENNRVFMNEYKGITLFKDAFSSDEIYVFDEDFKENNVHRIFLNCNKKIYDEDISMNPTSRRACFVRSFYSPTTRKFEWEQFKNARYYWDKGRILSVEKKENHLEKKEYLYMHFQSRKMRNYIDPNEKCIQILPDRFVAEEKIPESIDEYKNVYRFTPNMFWIDTYGKKITRKLKKVKEKYDA